MIQDYKQIYFLTGFMAVGKTYWGQRMSHSLKIPVYDLDERIEESTQMSISEFFQRNGEAQFRKIESRLLIELVAIIKGKAIISLGGGTLMDPRNLEFVKEHGYLIWLRTSSFNITENTFAERPLLIDNPIKDLYRVREQHYRLADFTIDVDKGSDEDVESELKKIIQ